MGQAIWIDKGLPGAPREMHSTGLPEPRWHLGFLDADVPMSAVQTMWHSGMQLPLSASGIPWD